MPSRTDARASQPIVRGTATVSPADTHNQRLVDLVHPEDWVNPEPAPRYNLVVVGAGTAGLVTAAGAAGLGAKVALVERSLMGGDCLNYGCVPSKALLRTARAVADVRDAGRFGVVVPDGSTVDFEAVMQRMRTLRAGIAGNDSAERFKGLGVHVFLGEGRFTGPGTLTVGRGDDAVKLRFARACIATGARAATPPIPGLAEAGFLTNETVFNLTELPPRLAVIGGGPIGCELAQAFARFGSRVVLLQSGSHILCREDADAAAVVEQALRRDGVELLTGTTVTAVEQTESGTVVRHTTDGREGSVTVDTILLGVGRTANVEGLGLETAGVAFAEGTGIEVNDRLQTTNPRIFAAGDVCSRFKFTHAADAMARIVIQNALFKGRAKASALTIPWCTYTDPELAHVGLSPAQAEAEGLQVTTFVQRLAEVDRAILDGEDEGLVKVHTEQGSDRILGATVVARHAGDLLSELTLAVVGGLGLKTIAQTIHPYPTQAEAIKRIGDQYQRTRLTPTVSKLMDGWLSLTR